MDLSFYPLTMEAVDQADAEALCLFVAADERPLTGLAGLADWRLCGRLSRMIRAGLVTGSGGEALLTPPGSRLSFKKLFVFGLGDATTEDELASRVAEALRKLAHAGVRDAALQLPARLPPERGVRTLMEGDGALSRALVFASEPARLVTLLSQSSGAPQVERRVVKVPSPPKASPPPRTRTHRTTPARGSPAATAPGT
ncbi:MAG TPA: M17 family peptidase N-terminal domain-containing protein, partial [Myxococcales bacterium]|nr:M17 family peptidase N-terminal domain-containing protein [Myxococcales bacterium]